MAKNTVQPNVALRICHRVLTAFAVALVLTVGIPGAASAAVFFCPPGDVLCLIGSIQSANASKGPDTIILEAGTYTFTVPDNRVDTPLAGGFLGNALPSITGRVTILGAGQTETIIDGSHSLRLFHIAATGKLTLHGLTIQGGLSQNGGAIFNRGTLTVSQTVLRDNRAPLGGGGAIFSIEGALRIVDSRVAR
jgi:hypothetical protein